jgi:endonuclease I
MRYTLYTVLLLTIFLATHLRSQVPADYYEGTEGLAGEELRLALHEIINDHITFSYADLRDFILKETDEDPENPDNVILIYSGISRAKDEFGGFPGNWNREHVWAKSHGGFENIPAEGTDAHHIRPADVQINGTRGNLDFDNGGSPVPGCPGCRVDNDSFEPGDNVKGDVARMIFYMATRYLGGGGELFLDVVDEVNTSPEPLHGKLSTLMEWHESDPPDAFELNRNEVIYSYQENRNPFIDHPEFVEAIWGEPTGNGEIYTSMVNFYPNPVVDQLIIHCDQSVITEFLIYNSFGMLVDKGLIRKQQVSIAFSEFNNGMYVVVVKGKNDGPVEKFKVIKVSR